MKEECQQTTGERSIPTVTLGVQLVVTLVRIEIKYTFVCWYH